MYTQCPECRTIFEIDEEALQASLGIVHCGKCAKRFDALRSLSESLPADPDATLGDDDAESRVLTLTTAVAAAGQEPAARRKRRREKPSPAATAYTATPESTENPVVEPAPAPASDEAPENPEADLTAALIADQSGAEPSTRAEPVQTRFAELDIIPLSPTELAAIESERHGSSLLRDTTPADGVDADHGDRGVPATDEPVLESAATADAGDDPQLPPAAPADESSNRADDVDSDAANESPNDAAAAPADGNAADAMQADPHAPVHMYVRPRARWYAHAGLWWAFACVLLALTLAAQLAWSQRAALFRNPQTRPWIAQVCSNLPCHLPLIRDVSKLELVSRDIRPDPATAGALEITATLRNDAAFRQPWPIVVVELSDIDGNPVAMRRFRPAEYMPDPARRTAGIAPGVTAAVAFEVADPGKRAVNFQFSFE
ncbi:MAG TPA: DUF3426 domain-containing protein [Rhodanobacteraceae bacterium]|nr:DUF3426 domain-containing protein [Rhodanobacteraceae bacterium]